MGEDQTLIFKSDYNRLQMFLARFHYIFAVIVILLGVSNILSQYQIEEESEHPDTTCIACHLAMNDNFYTTEFSLSGTGTSFNHESHQIVSCSQCHYTLKEIPHREMEHNVLSCLDCHTSERITTGEDHFEIYEGDCENCHSLEREVPELISFSRFKSSTHSQLGCMGCHINADEPHFDGNLKVKDCDICHKAVSVQFEESVHHKNDSGFRLICLDCHSAHYTKNTSAWSWMEEYRICADCHNDIGLMEKYGVNPDTVSTYENSYHFRRYEGEDEDVAGCIHCHGYHDVLREENPMSSVHPDNLNDTCFQSGCHRYSAFTIIIAPSHIDPMGNIIGWSEYVILNYFVWILVGLLVLLFFHFLLFGRLHSKMYKGDDIKRHSFYQRIVKIIHILSFIWLSISGFIHLFVGKYPSINYYQMSISHYIAGVIYIITSISISMMWIKRAKFERYDWKWMKAFGGYLSFKRKNTHTAFFNAGQKLFYWFVVLYSFIMIVSGVILFITKTFTIVRIIHLIGAFFGLLAIIKHIYLGVVLNPEAFRSLVKGSVHSGWVEENHPCQGEN